MSDSEKELFGDEGDNAMDAVSDAESAASIHEPVRHEALLKRYAPSHESSHAWLSRIPAFLNLEPRPFEAAKYAAVERSDDQLALEANTIRWKYAAAADGDSEQKVTRVSNARIVEWSDGSRTLQLGNEQFAIRTRSLGDPAFICTQHEDENLMATRELVDDTMAFLPTSTSSATHIMLAKALQRKQASGQIRVGSVNTVEDPDKVQRDLEKAEQAKEKARKKLAAQRDELVSYTDRSIGSSRGMPVDEDEEMDVRDEEEDEDEESEAQESDEEEQEENDDDDDDEDERAKRLNEIKHQQEERAESAPIQRRRILDDDDDEDSS